MIWVVGKNGMLGTQLREALTAKHMDFYATDRDVDITEPVKLEAFAADKSISWIINCSAYTAVDRAEDETELAWRINALGPGNLSSVARKLGARLIHISTDYVFDGNKPEAYVETDDPNPQSVYGMTKWQGEQEIRKNLPSHFIIRTSWLFGEHGPNFVFTMLRLMKERERLSVVSDQKGTPTWTGDLVNGIFRFIEKDSTSYGTYHFSNEGALTWFDFACKIQDLAMSEGLLKNRIPIHPVSTAEYPTKAKRPANSLLNKEKIKQTLQFSIPFWSDSLELFLKSCPREKIK